MEIYLHVTRGMLDGTVVMMNRLQALFWSRGLRSGCQWNVIQLLRNAFPSSPEIQGKTKLTGHHNRVLGKFKPIHYRNTRMYLTKENCKQVTI